MSELENEIREQAVKQAVERLLGEDKWASSNLLNKISELVAERVAEDYFDRNHVSLLKAVDLDTVVKLATFKLIAKLTKTLKDDY